MANLSANYLRKARNWDSYLPDASDLRRLTRSVGLSRGRDDSAHAALAVGFVAGAFMAVGALAIARVAIGKMAIGKLHLRELEIDDFTVHRIHNGSGAAISQQVEGDESRGLALPAEEALTKEDLSDHDEEQPAGGGKRSRGRKNGGRADRSD
jgi:ABC-type uncharacterized transport system YnjBCD ATPase subunit